MGFLSKKKKQKPEEILDLPPLPPTGEEEDLGPKSVGEEIPPPPELEKELPPFPSPIEKEELPPLPKAGLPEEPTMPPLEEELPPLPKAGLPEEHGLPPLPETELPEEPTMPPLEELPPLPKAGLPEEPIMPPLEELPPLPKAGLPEEPGLPPLEEELPKAPLLKPSFIPLKPRIIPKPIPTFPRPTETEPEKPAVREHIFVRIDDFKTVLREINLIKGDLTGSEEALLKLNNLEEEKNKIYEKWYENITLIQKKLTSVDKMLSKGG